MQLRFQVTTPYRSGYKKKKELHFCNSFFLYEPSRNSTGQAYLGSVTYRLSRNQHPACVAKTESLSVKTSDLGIKKGVTLVVTPFQFMSPLPGSNQRPTDYKSVALPAELKRPTFMVLQI